MSKLIATTTGLPPSSRMPTKIDLDMARLPETQAQLRRIAKFVRTYERRSKAASAAVIACNHEVPGLRAVIFIPTKEAQVACDRAEAASKALDQAYRESVTTSDMPDHVLWDMLHVRIRDCGGTEEWCRRNRERGGPRISPRWLSRILMKVLRCRWTWIDKRVHRAMMMEDSDAARARRD